MNPLIKMFLTAIIKAVGALLLTLATEAFAQKITKIIALWALDALAVHATKTATPIDDQLIAAMRAEVATKIPD